MRALGQIVSRRRGVAAASLAYFVLLGLVTAFVSPPVENIVRDIMTVSISPFVRPPPDIVLVAITEQTLADLPYRSPLDRGFLADLVSRIEAARPRAIGIDLLFDQPTEPSKDALLQAALENATVPLVIASGSTTDGLTEKQRDYLNAFATSAKRGLAVISHDNLDGVARGAFLGREGASGWSPSFAAAIAAATGINVAHGPEEMVYYRTADGLPFEFTAYPAEAVSLAPLNWFDGKYVLIGVDLPQTDRHLTPFALAHGVDIGRLPGVSIHAHSLASLVSGDRITVPPWPLGYAPMVAVGLFCLWIAWRPMPVSFKPIAVAGALLLAWVSEAFAFAYSAILFPMVAPAFLLFGLCGYVGFLAWKRDTKARHFIQSAFSKYVSPAVVEAMVKQPATLRLGGERRMIVAVFTDVEDFTSLSEKLAPELLADILNDYLGSLCELFVEHGATIDKIIGDAVVGFFGAPSEQNDQAARAVALTLAVQDLAQRLREPLAANGHPFGATRIGVHGGPAIVGNFGGDRFFNYTAIGDTINTAARLEGANKFLGTRNCISADVAKLAYGLLFRPAGVLYLKGKSEGVEVFEAFSQTPENATLCDDYSKAYRLLAAKDIAAIAAFECLIARYPQDRLIAFHHQRLTKGCNGVDIHLAEK